MSDALLKKVLKEVQELRQEVSLFMPTESLNDFKHPKRILSSYEKATRSHPPRKR